MIRGERQICVSTDAAGAFGNPEKVRSLWPKGMDLGLEVLGWQWLNLSDLVKQDENSVVGIHGRMGKIPDCSKSPVWTIVDEFLIPSRELIRMGSNVAYILVHEGEGAAKKEIFIKSAEQIRCLMVENSRSVGSIGQTIGLVEELRRGGVETGLMFDLYHFFGTLRNNDDIGVKWAKTMKKLDEVFSSLNGAEIPVGIHLSVGTDRSDSLPFEEMTCEMWRKLGHLIHENQLGVLVIENRQRFPGWLWPINVRNQRARNERIVETLGEGGVISPV